VFDRRLDAPLILASASASRADILRNAGLIFRQIPSDVDERAIEADLASENMGQDDAFPERLALALAEAKALAVSKDHPGALVIGADTVMACGGEVLHKPGTIEAARQQLMRLRGRAHSLFSAVCIASGANVAWRHCEGADLAMRDFSDEFLDAYCLAEGEELFRSVGSYRVEGPGIQLFSAMCGDVHTIMGLPLLPLLGYLRDTGKLMR
jgi:septum formation protein